MSWDFGDPELVADGKVMLLGCASGAVRAPGTAPDDAQEDEA
jgi:hypothetical protein